MGPSPGSQAHWVDVGTAGGQAETRAREGQAGMEVFLRSRGGVGAGVEAKRGGGGCGLRLPSMLRTPFSWLLIRCRELLKYWNL